MTASDEKMNPYAQPAHASVPSRSRTLRPDERQYLSQLLAFRRAMPPVSSAVYALMLQFIWSAAGTGIAAAAVGTVTGVLLELTPGQSIAILFVLFFCIEGVIVCYKVSAMQSTYALWEVASRVHDLAEVERMLQSGRLPGLDEEANAAHGVDGGSVAS